MKIKNLACLTIIALSGTFAYAADISPSSKYEFAKYAALNEVCADLVPAKRAFFMANRYAYEAKHDATIKRVAKDSDYARLVNQYKNMMLAADTVYGAELCEQIDFSEAPLRLVSPNDGESKGG